jgi:hypothetical protein
MSQTSNTAIAVIGIDIGKNSFHVVGHDARGAILALFGRRPPKRVEGVVMPASKNTTADMSA